MGVKKLQRRKGWGEAQKKARNKTRAEPRKIKKEERGRNGDKAERTGEQNQDGIKEVKKGGKREEWRQGRKNGEMEGWKPGNEES
jgi:hypothetical protein